MVGDMKQTVDVTYLADTVIMLALLRGDGARPARDLGASRSAAGSHEDTIRELRIGSDGI